jgi:hypothetical protein
LYSFEEELHEGYDVLVRLLEDVDEIDGLVTVEVQLIGSFLACWIGCVFRFCFIHDGNLLLNWLSKSKVEISFVTTFPEPSTRLFAPFMVFYSP